MRTTHAVWDQVSNADERHQVEQVGNTGCTDVTKFVSGRINRLRALRRVEDKSRDVALRNAQTHANDEG